MDDLVMSRDQTIQQFEMSYNYLLSAYGSLSLTALAAVTVHAPSCRVTCVHWAELGSNRTL